MSKFTKHHYEAIATVLSDTVQAEGRELLSHEIVQELANMFERDNPRFNRNRFLTKALHGGIYARS